MFFQTTDQIRICVAPMMGYTDRFCRMFHRVLAPSARLYTEMVHANALVHGREDLVAFRPMERPVALQLGGREPGVLARATKIAAKLGYSEVNLNCGCPSGRVQSGGFGACLMLDPRGVEECLRSMVEAAQIPITVKCRLGVNNQFSYERFAEFINNLRVAGVAMVIVHARQALLNGISPKENRAVPPLRYDWVYRLKQEFAELPIVLNGGIKNLDQACVHLEKIDGVMIGRSAYQDPYLLHQMNAALFQSPLKTRLELLAEWREYAEQEVANGVPIKHLARHVAGLFYGQPGGKRFRAALSSEDVDDWRLMERALRAMSPR